MFLHFKSFIIIASLILTSGLSIVAQQSNPEKEEKRDKKQNKGSSAQNATAEQVAESSVIIYGGLVGGRNGLNQIRKTTVERGKMVITNNDGTVDQASYEKRILRGDSLEKERIRFDQEFPTAKFALIYQENKVKGLFNDSVFTPREDASLAFTNQIWRGLEGLLRYKENGSTLTLRENTKSFGVEFYVLDVKDKLERLTTYYISVKSFRVMMLEYKEGNVQYQRKFADYRYAQGTLVPYRTTLTANGKLVEETSTLTVTFGQKVEEDIFQTS